MKKIFAFVLAGALLLSACGGGMTEEEHGHEDGEGVEAHDYWARAAMAGGNSAAYMLLHNHGAEADALISASSDVAEAVELHLSQMNADGTMEMIQQEKIDLPADGEVELKPGSYHIMLIGLKQDLMAGSEITITMTFENAGEIVLTVPVKDSADMGGSGMDGHNMP
jgi:copper(I)-binding protein